MIRERRSGAVVLIFWLLAWAAVALCLAEMLLR